MVNSLYASGLLARLTLINSAGSVSAYRMAGAEAAYYNLSLGRRAYSNSEVNKDRICILGAANNISH